MSPIALTPVSNGTASVADQIKKNRSTYKDQSTGAEEYNHATEVEGLGEHGAASYTAYLPTWDPNEKYPPLKPFTHVERGLSADPALPAFYNDQVEIDDLTPTIGTEVKGLQLTDLSENGKDQLALFVARRKVVVFRDQNFADLPIDQALAWGGYFGRHHIHPSSGAPKGFPEIHLVHRGVNDVAAQQLLANQLSTIAWHSDVTYELQPPGVTFLYILDKPTSGGDTIFANGVEAYNRLSPAFQERLHGLKAVHSGIEQAEAARARNSIVRREPVTNVHPLVRTHPATGEKALFVNQQFTKYIVGLKKEESDLLLNFLFQHIALGSDFHVRVKWQAKSVIAWDNRLTSHSAILDWVNGQRRHLARITPQAEPPYETPFEVERDEVKQ